MEFFSYSKSGIKYRQIWFNQYTSLQDIGRTNADILEFRESHTLIHPSLTPFNNAIIDLRIGLTQIHDSFDKGFKYEIRRAEKEKVFCEECELAEESLLNAMFSDYVSFSKAKGIPFIPLEFLKRYNASKHLKISFAKIDQSIVQYHLYFSSQAENILLASFPGLRSANYKNNLLGFANRALHWFDIQKTFETKKAIYNLGGIGNSDNEHTAGIIKFKNEMAPDIKTYYHGLVPMTLKGHYFLKLKNFYKRHVQIHFN